MVPGTSIIGGGATPLGYQQISAATLAAATSLTVPTGATVAVVQVDTAAVYWRDDGSAPTGSSGIRIAAGITQAFGPDSLIDIQFIKATGGLPVLNVSYY
jgi:hypothetical protein